MKKMIIIKRVVCLVGLLLWSIDRVEAQQTGPNTPDFYGFEPVDATDMVDMSTGDLTYTIPLMNVPGPGSGYPIVLSYTAGVGVGQESTWVGMGWRLTPGGIHRSVSGAPDDVDMRNWNYSYASGTMEYTTAGVSYADPSGLMSFGVTKSWGDYNSIGVSAGYGPLSINADNKGNVGLSVSPLETFSPSKAKESNPVMSLSVGVNYNTGTKKGGGYASLGKSGIGVSLSGNSEGSSFNASYLGNSLMAGKNVSSNESFTTTTTQSGISLPIPTPVGFFSLRYSKTKTDWESKELTYTKQVGLMHSFDDPDHYDIYNRSNPTTSMDVLNFTPEAYHFQNTWVGTRTPTIMLPAYDNYSVVAQGMSFSMENNLMETGMLSTYGSVDDVDRPLEFYGLTWGAFISGNNNQIQVSGSNSGSWQINPGTLDKTITANDILNNDALHAFHYENTPTVSYLENDGSPHSNLAMDYIDYSKFGKKNIKYYTNQQIIDGGIQGFIESNALDVAKRTALPESTRSGIGAYSITNEQGVTYHYSLPVYQKETITAKLSEDGNNHNYNFTKDYYASSWLLTAITGPDYVDVNNIGEVNIGDYGYWVKFDYGLFNDGYPWRSYTDFKENYSDDKNKWKTISYGLKDIYYLDQIQTTSHTAMFFKGERKDGLFKQPLSGLAGLMVNYGGTLDADHTVDPYCHSARGYFHYPLEFGRLMNLDKIALFSNDNLPQISQQSHGVESPYSLPADYYTSDIWTMFTAAKIGIGIHCIDDFNNIGDVNYPGFKFSYRRIAPYQMDNLLDFEEYSAYGSDIESKALKIIDLNYSYDIQNGGLNSADPNLGKLTLTYIDELARDSVLAKPPTRFDYYLDNNIDMTNHDEDSYDQLKEDITDEWGYYNPNYNQLEANSWSLKSIETPVGSKMNIVYEEDEYINEYALADHIKTMVTDINSTPEADVYELTFPNRFGDQYSINEHVTLHHTQDFGFIEEWDYECEILEINNMHNKIKVKVLYAVYLNDNSNYQYSNTGSLMSSILDRISFSEDVTLFTLELKKQTSSFLQSVKGGGLRVAEIKVTDDIKTYSTKYDYRHVDNQMPSGYTSFAPKNYYRPYYIPYNAFIPNPGVKYEYVSEMSTSLNGDIESKTVYHFNIPKGCDNCYGSEYEILGGDHNETSFFSVTDEFNQNNIVAGTEPVSSDGFSYYLTNPTGSSNVQKSAFSARESTINNGLNKVGELLSVKRYNEFGQNIHSKINTYEDNERAIKQEGYYNRKVVGTHGAGWNKYSYLNTLATYRETPRKLSRVQTESLGVSNTIEYRDYDLLLGVARTTLTENSLGDRHRTKTIYAHEVYPEMGHQLENPSNRNMLTQEAASYLYVDNGNADYADDPVINSSITTWNKDWTYREFKGGRYQTTSQYPNNNADHEDIWRKETTYSWRNKLDPETGAYKGADGNAFSSDDEFDFNTLGNNSEKWVQNSSITLYDHYSNPVEVKDVNGQYASSKKWRNLTVSSIVGSAYSGYSSSGAEDLKEGTNYTNGGAYFETEVFQGTGSSLETSISHTGKNSVKVTYANVSAFISKFVMGQDRVNPDDTYMLSVWVKGTIGTNASNVSLKLYPNGSGAPTIISNPEIIQAGEWRLLRYTFQGISGALNTTFNVSIGSGNYAGDLYFDDYRLYPVGASMSTYVYDDQDRVEYILNGNNLATKYVYDQKGRLKEIQSEVVGDVGVGGFVKTASSNVHFIRDNEQ